jgi:secreted trypsin-like serine protease
VSRLIRLETGSAVFRTEEQALSGAGAAANAQAGDSGGGCVQSRDRNALVGITSVGAQKAMGGRMSIFTSVYSHRSWLLQMIKKADES